MHWTNVFTAFEDPEIREQWDDTEAIFTEIVEYCQAEIERRRENPTEDLVSALMDAEVDGERLDDLEIATFFILLMAAGNDSTRATYSGIMKSLLEQPELMQRLRDDPTLIPAAVEEGLRLLPRVCVHGPRRHRGRRVQRRADQGGRPGAALVPGVQSRRDRSSRTRTHSTSTVRTGPTTRPSARAAATSASAPPSPASS